MAIQLTTEAFEVDGPIPVKYTGDGRDTSPPLAWTGLPSGTKELALIVDDPDAPQPEPFVHWVVCKIPASASGLPEGVPKQAKLESPPGALQGKNDFNQTGYGGPAPPPGHGIHHYHFRLYALDEPLEVQPGLDRKALTAAMAGRILDEGELVGTYERRK
jgi:Raf kinase inhibitor-like YbhB/YbcL family protein